MSGKKTGVQVAGEIIGGVLGTVILVFVAFIACIFDLAKKS